MYPDLVDQVVNSCGECEWSGGGIGLESGDGAGGTDGPGGGPMDEFFLNRGCSIDIFEY